MHAAIRSSKGSSSPESSGEFRRHGSLRRVLPPEPNKEPNMLVHDIETDKLTKIFNREYIILAEYKMLQTESLRGIYVVPSFESSFLWFGVMFVRRGFYEDGIFRFNVVLPDTFPDSGYPRVEFKSDVFHPCVDDETGELNLFGGFPEWRKGEEHVWQLLKYVEYVFVDIEHASKHAVNREANETYRNDRSLFERRVRRCVEESVERAFDPPPVDDKHYIRFSGYEPDVHEPVRRAILEPKNGESDRSAGRSWVEPGTFKPFAKANPSGSEH